MASLGQMRQCLRCLPKQEFFKIYFYLCIKKNIGVQLLYNAVLVSAVQQSESAIYVHIYPLFWVSFPFRSPQSTEQSSWCYAWFSAILISPSYLYLSCQRGLLQGSWVPKSQVIPVFLHLPHTWAHCPHPLQTSGTVFPDPSEVLSLVKPSKFKYYRKIHVFGVVSGPVYTPTQISPPGFSA